MPFPATAYDSATLVNPTGTLSSFPLPLDASRFTAEWWAAVNTTDGTRVRVFLEDGTRLDAFFFEFDSVNKTGWLLVRIPTWLTSGTMTIRVYPPNTANDPVAVDAAHGQHAVFPADYSGFWPDAGPTDRTANALNGTAINCTPGDIAGKVGAGTEFVRANESEIDFAGGETAADMSGLDAFSAAGCVRDESGTAFNSGGDRAWLSNHAFSNYQFRARRFRNATLRFDILSGSVVVTTSGAINDGVWRRVWMQKTPTHLEVWSDGVLLDSVAHTDPMPAGLTNSLKIGRVRQGSEYWDGELNYLQLVKGDRSAAWIEHDHAVIDDQASMVGAWTHHAAPSTGRRRAVVIG